MKDLNFIFTQVSYSKRFYFSVFLYYYFILCNVKANIYIYYICITHTHIHNVQLLLFPVTCPDHILQLSGCILLLVLFCFHFYLISFLFCKIIIIMCIHIIKKKNIIINSAFVFISFCNTISSYPVLHRQSSSRRCRDRGTSILQYNPARLLSPDTVTILVSSANPSSPYGYTFCNRGCFSPTIFTFTPSLEERRQFASRTR